MDEIEQWAASGAMALTGRSDGAPLVGPGEAASTVLRALESVADDCHSRTGVVPLLPGVELLGERAALAGFSRRAPWSCGGAFRAVPTRDGWLGLSLARPSDLDSLPALTGSADDLDPWCAVRRWSVEVSSSEAAERAALLGLAASQVPPAPELHERAGVVVSEGGPRAVVEQPRVLDLTSLWAGPLCAHLLGLGGARVTKVESSRRPDGARTGTPAFFDLLHRGHDTVILDFGTTSGRDRLRELIEQSDLVLEASRARALEQLGIIAGDYVAGGVSWLSITAYGREHNRVGFGDDVAVGAGLYIVDGDDVLPCGDALADPMAGAVAAASAAAALLRPRAQLIDLSMHDVAREAARRPVGPHRTELRDGAWWVETVTGCHPVLAPRARR